MSSFRNKHRLSLQSLEDRSVPATFSYLAGTLTVTAAEGNAITVQPSLNAPVGYLKVTDGNNTFDSLSKSQPVNNVIVNMGPANIASLTLPDGTFIPGNLTVLGAKQNSGVYSRAEIGQNFSYTPAPTAATDYIELTSEGSVAGNATFKLGAGNNTVSLTGGTIGGNLTVIGGSGADFVPLTFANDVVVKGSAIFNLGGGTNSVQSAGNGNFTIGKDLTYIGGAGDEDFDLDTGFDTTLGVGGKMKISLGAAAIFNRFETGELSVGSSLSITAGNQVDLIDMDGTSNIGGSVSINTGNGIGSVNLDGIFLGGSLTFNGGIDQDYFVLDSFVVGKNLTINAKGDALLSGQIVQVGFGTTNENAVFGSATIATGNGADTVALHRTTVGGTLKVATGAGVDTITMNDSSVARTTLFDLGGGADILEVDNSNADDGGALNGITTFGGTFTVKAGEGDDTVRLSSMGGNLIKFGSKVSLFGGVGTDTFESFGLNEFLGADSQEDFEADNGVPLS